MVCSAKYAMHCQAATTVTTLSHTNSLFVLLSYVWEHVRNPIEHGLNA